MKKKLFKMLTFAVILCLFTVPTFAWGRKLITKSVSDSFYQNYLSYSFKATAGITYNDSNQITQISDLSFSNITVTSSLPGVTGTIIPSQKSKNYSGTRATYVVKVTRNALGVYQDSVDYTITYNSTDAGTPYSLPTLGNGELIDGVWVVVDVSEPYDIIYLE